jgi:hypothetical protein
LASEDVDDESLFFSELPDDEGFESLLVSDDFDSEDEDEDEDDFSLGAGRLSVL